MLFFLPQTLSDLFLYYFVNHPIKNSLNFRHPSRGREVAGGIYPTLIPVLILALLALEFFSISFSSGIIALLFTSSNAFL